MPTQKADAPAPTGGPAKVRVGAKGGFCNVTVNGASYGPTPVEAPVTSGTVRVSCKPASGPSMSQTVKVEPGATARVLWSELGESLAQRLAARLGMGN